MLSRIISGPLFHFLIIFSFVSLLLALILAQGKIVKTLVHFSLFYWLFNLLFLAILYFFIDKGPEAGLTTIISCYLSFVFFIISMLALTLFLVIYGNFRQRKKD